VFPNSGYYFIALLVAAVAAFWPKYVSRPFGSVDAYTHAHAIAMVLWCGLLIVQPLLIKTGRRSLHRGLGATSYVLAPCVLVASVLLAHFRFRSMDEATFAAEAPSLYLPLSGFALFGACYAAAMVWRRTPAVHARFMIGTALTTLDPVVGRLLFFYLPPLPHYLLYQAVTFGGTDALIAFLARKDRGLPQVRWAFPAMLAVFAVTHLLWFTLAQSTLWRPVAAWFRSLPLT
jgi:uncharacterized membrane protein YozB (DUF420 family)